jgi:hypothetical protein
MRLMMIALLSLLLSGCWVGHDFYGPADLRQPLAAGDYEAMELSRDRPIDESRVRIVHRSDGHLTATPIDARGREDHADASTMGFVPLDPAGRLFVTWQLSREPETGIHERVYALLRREASGAFIWLLPRCQGREADAARAAGATIANTEGMVPTCRFSTREQLEAAFRAAEPHMRPMMRLTPLTR